MHLTFSLSDCPLFLPDADEATESALSEAVLFSSFFAPPALLLTLDLENSAHSSADKKVPCQGLHTGFLLCNLNFSLNIY